MNKSIFGTIIIILVVAVLISSNPKTQDFKEFCKEQIAQNGIKSDDFGGAIQTLLAPIGSWWVSLNTVRTNYFIFSTYEITILGETQVYLGVLSNFVKIR